MSGRLPLQVSLLKALGSSHHLKEQSWSTWNVLQFFWVFLLLCGVIPFCYTTNQHLCLSGEKMPSTNSHTVVLPLFNVFILFGFVIGSCYVIQADLKLVVLLPQFRGCFRNMMSYCLSQLSSLSLTSISHVKFPSSVCTEPLCLDHLKCFWKMKIYIFTRVYFNQNLKPEVRISRTLNIELKYHC